MITELRRFRPRYCRQDNKAVPNALAAKIDWLRFALAMGQEPRISLLQFDKGTARNTPVPVGEDHRHETGVARDCGG